MRSRLGLPSQPEKPLTIDAGRCALSLFAKPCGLIRETPFKSFCLFETTPLWHGALLFPQEERRERVMAFSSPMDASGGAVIGPFCPMELKDATAKIRNEFDVIGPQRP
jgi:hypothetical protein